MQTAMRYVKKIIVYSSAAIIALIIAVVSILVIANLVLTNKKVSEIIVQQLETNLLAEVHCEVTHFSLFNGFEIQNFTLTEINSTTPVIRFDMLRLHYSLLWALFGKIKVYEWLGKYFIKTGEITQSGGFVEDLWKKGIKEVERILVKEKNNFFTFRFSPFTFRLLPFTFQF